jgi:hypothetical protein
VEERLQAIARRLPFRDKEIERLAQHDGTFFGICEDYADAEAALGHWNAASPNATARSRMREYATLVEELAVEIEQLLDDAACAAKPGKQGT